VQVRQHVRVSGPGTGRAALWAIDGARLADGSEADLLIDGGRIVAVGPGVAARGPGLRDRDVVDANGGLLLPAFVDTHVHLDKAGIRAGLDTARRYPGSAHPGDLAWAIAATHDAKRAYTVGSVAARATAVIESHVLHGTTRIRSHVDVDTIGGLTPLRGVRAAAAACADIADVVTIAFPQEGIARDPGTAGLMVAAMEEGADVVGGMPHWEDGEAAQGEHVRFCFDLAQRFDADVDMHVDETDDGDVRTLATVVEETERLGWQGRVTVGHVCALAASDDAYAAEVVAACARAGITVASNPVTNLVLQGRGDRGLVRRGTTRVRELLDAGVPVAFGQDCVRDAFYPFGRASMLEVALVSAHAAHLTTPTELRTALAAVTDVPAAAWRLGGEYGVAPGARADLQLYAAPTWEDALRLQDPPRSVWRAGRLVATTEVTRTLRPSADDRVRRR
jgi:cytosine deaminase